MVPNEQNLNTLFTDFVVRLQDVKEVLHTSDTQFKIYPIWLCPIKHVPHKEIDGVCSYNIIKNEETPFYVDVGIYG